MFNCKRLKILEDKVWELERKLDGVGNYEVKYRLQDIQDVQRETKIFKKLISAVCDYLNVIIDVEKPKEETWIVRKVPKCKKK